jgi:hypothetical protein
MRNAEPEPEPAVMDERKVGHLYSERRRLTRLYVSSVREMCSTNALFRLNLAIKTRS